ncbi:O-antigen ligase family protein [Geodermatophilus sp. SYSU D00700]
MSLLLILLAYGSVSLISALTAPAGSPSDRRVYLLLYLVLISWAVVALAGTRPTFTRAVRRGAVWGLALTAAMDGLQYASWLTLGPGVPAVIGPLDFTSPTLGLEAPRLAGLSLDPNRGAFFVCLCAYFLVLDRATALARGSRARVWCLASGGLLTLLSFSRTGIVLYLLILMAAWRRSRGEQGSRRRAGGLMVAVALGVLVAWVYPAVSTQVDVTSLLTERANFGSGASGGIHLDLVSRGLEVVGQTAWGFFFGIGVGNAPLVLGDIFPNNPYANFHSIYIASAVEGGILATALLMVIMFRPLTWRPMLVVLLALFGVFYQANLDPMSWFATAFAWCAPLWLNRSEPSATTGADKLGDTMRDRPDGSAAEGAPREAAVDR